MSTELYELRCGHRVEALYEARKRHPQHPNIAASIANGLRNCVVLHASTPKDVRGWLQKFCNNFGGVRCNCVVAFVAFINDACRSKRSLKHRPSARISQLCISCGYVSHVCIAMHAFAPLWSYVYLDSSSGSLSLSCSRRFVQQKKLGSHMLTRRATQSTHVAKAAQHNRFCIASHCEVHFYIIVVLRCGCHNASSTSVKVCQYIVSALPALPVLLLYRCSC
jgi:hypothetical protein